METTSPSGSSLAYFQECIAVLTSHCFVEPHNLESSMHHVQYFTVLDSQVFRFFCSVNESADSPRCVIQLSNMEQNAGFEYKY